MKATGKQIRESVTRWLKWLGLDGWQVTVKIGRIAGGHRGTAECDPTYLEAILRFDPVQMEKHGDDIEEIVAHECTHLLVWNTHLEVQRLAKNGIAENKLCQTEESEVTQVSRAFLRLAREGRLLK